ncbi:SCO family protein [uncultured Paraglaciecola sp.]|uniref:SCO family protein n=1 Tax=uncultured Paraglaciecola sp. TaxID=1765024 RepID=UPI0030DD51BF
MKLSLLIIMHRKIIKLVTSTLLLVVALNVSAESLPFYNSKEFTPHWIEPTSAKLENFHQIPSFSFVDQDGKNVTEKSFENKIYVAGFFFSTCPGICPMIRSKLAKVQETFVEDPEVKILQHSIRPTTDTVEILKAYADEHDIKSGKWHVVTGDKDAIYKLAKTAYFASDDLGNIQNTNDFLHTESILLIDKNRHIRGIYNGLNSASMAYLIADIENLKTEFLSQ